MIKLIASIALIIASILGGISPASASAPTLPACQNEDGSIGTNEDGSTIYEECKWNAKTQGNGQGQSIINHEDGTFTPIPNEAPVAPVVDTMEAQAWMLFDAVDAASLLPAEGGQVSYIGHNTTGFPYLTADLITVWDNNGNHYLFQVG